MKVCSVEGCNKNCSSQGYCKSHYDKARRCGLIASIRKSPGSGTIKKSGYTVYRLNGVDKYEHVLVAEKVLGGELPKDAVVHHIDRNPRNNSPENLLICPNQAYHQIIHQRLRAYEACGNANYLKCTICKQYDDPSNLTLCRVNRGHHKECQKRYDAIRRAKS